MKKVLGWGLPMAALAIIIGCGGNGSGSAIVTTGGDGRTAPTVILNDIASVQTYFVTGQGRRQATSLVAVVKSLRYENSITEQFLPGLDFSTYPELHMRLDSYSDNSRIYNAIIPQGDTSLFYDSLPFEINRIDEVDNATGQVTQLTSAAPAVFQNPPFTIGLRVFRGRTTTMQYNLNDGSLGFDPIAGAIFDSDFFLFENLDIQTGVIRGFFSDYISFDLSNMPAADRPLLADNTAADRVLFSGDGICHSSGLGATSKFEFLNPIKIEAGRIFGGVVLGGVTAKGTFNLLEDDPRDLNNIPITDVAKLTALKGTWVDHKEVIIPNSDFSVLAIPNTMESNEQQLVIYSANQAGKVTKMWQGVVRYGDGGDPKKGHFSLWPISQIDDASVANQIDGEVYDLVYVNDVVRDGKYTVTAGPNTFPFPRQGQFTVYRK